MSIGVVIVTHNHLGEEFLKALQQIVPDPPEFESVSIEPGQSSEGLRKGIDRALSPAAQEKSSSANRPHNASKSMSAA